MRMKTKLLSVGAPFGTADLICFRVLITVRLLPVSRTVLMLVHTNAGFSLLARIKTILHLRLRAVLQEELIKSFIHGSVPFIKVHGTATRLVYTTGWATK